MYFADDSSLVSAVSSGPKIRLRPGDGTFFVGSDETTPAYAVLLLGRVRVSVAKIAPDPDTIHGFSTFGIACTAPFMPQPA